MPIRFFQGDALDSDADALLLTIDGAKKGMEGNVARAFARRWPDAFEEVEDEVSYTLPLGRTIATRPESDCSFPLVLIASTLHHLDVLSDSQKAGIVRSALSEAILIATRNRIRKLATPVMTGGWRVSFADALSAMFLAARPLMIHDSRVVLEICVRDSADFDTTMSLAKALGITSGQ
jgi:O-acetyl-ADP-ribose deacetylase (regulator of RNase III)